MATQTRSIGPIVLATGRSETPVLNVNQNATQIRCVIDAAQHLNPLVNITVALEVSYDDGATWQVTASSTRPGGPAFGDGGVPVTDFELTTNFDQPSSIRRRIKMSVVCENGSFTTAGGTLEASDTAFPPRTVTVARIPFGK